MNCQETKRHWDLYFDSEGDAELHFQINEHLNDCASCAEWFSKESRLESLIEDRLTTPRDDDASIEALPWNQILKGAGVMPVSKSRSWFSFGSAMLALAASLLLVLGVGWPAFYTNRTAIDSPSLSQLSGDVHRHVSSGSLRPEFESESDIEVDAYLLKRVSFPVRCPPRKDSGFHVSGAGMCDLAAQPAAYVIGSVAGEPISIFVLSEHSLTAFPQLRSELSRGQVFHCRESGQEIAMSVIDRNVVLVVGKVDRERLSHVLKSYGTYPHAS